MSNDRTPSSSEALHVIGTTDPAAKLWFAAGVSIITWGGVSPIEASGRIEKYGEKLHAVPERTPTRARSVDTAGTVRPPERQLVVVPPRLTAQFSLSRNR